MELILFKYIWLIAVLPKMAQLPILTLMLVCLYRREGKLLFPREKIASDPYMVLLGVCTAIHAFSILDNAFSGQYTLSRVLAACNTFAITCVALGFYHFYSHAEINTQKVQKYMFMNMNILFGLFLLYKLIGDKGNLPIIGTLSGWDEVVAGIDTTRFAGYLEYANMTVFMYLYCYAFSVEYLRGKVNKPVLVAIEILYILPLAAANSRTGVVCGVVLTGASFLLTKIEPVKQYYLANKRRVWILGAVLLAGSCIVLHEPLAAVLDKILSYRAGSTTTRTYIYTKSIEKMLTESPIWGCGIKAILPELGYPYGSHSTYFGMFYKTGILGGTIYLIATAIAIVGIIRRKESSAFDILISFSFLALFAFALLEDLDGSNWNLVMFLSLFSLFVSNKQTDSVTE